LRVPEVPWPEVLNSDAEEESLNLFPWSEGTRSLERMIRHVAPTNVPVLLVGESGTGKSFRARQIHGLSSKSTNIFKSTISSSVTPESIEAELRSRISEDSARTGTLFLKEVSELSGPAQRTLLYSIPEEESPDSKLQSLRLICSTAIDLDREVHAGRFRRDLYYRLKGVCLHIAPLREHKADIPVLADLFLAKHASIHKRPQPELEPTDYAVLQNWNWPGNIRELENAMREIVVLSDAKSVLQELRGPSENPEKATSPDRDNHGVALKIAARAASRQLEEQLIIEALAKTRWNRKKAAQELQISYKSLLSKLKQMGGGKTA
jgi:two-component system response regulator AtoC